VTHKKIAECSAPVRGSEAEKIISGLREWARRAVLEAAAQYTSELTGNTVTLPEDLNDRLLLMTGHQPALYHPGVWVKNLLIGKVARKTAGLSLNLIVDNDLVSSTSIRVPQGTRSARFFLKSHLMNQYKKKPWEETTIQTKSCSARLWIGLTKHANSGPNFPLLCCGRSGLPRFPIWVSPIV